MRSPASNNNKQPAIGDRVGLAIGSEISSVEIIGTERYILRKRGLPAAISGHEIKGEIIPRIKCSILRFKYNDYCI